MPSSAQFLHKSTVLCITYKHTQSGAFIHRNAHQFTDTHTQTDTHVQFFTYTFDAKYGWVPLRRQKNFAVAAFFLPPKLCRHRQVLTTL